MTTTIDLSNTANARDWAKEFMRLFDPSTGDPSTLIDESLMTTWFANAIEAAKDYERRGGVWTIPQKPWVFAQMDGSYSVMTPGACDIGLYLESTGAVECDVVGRIK